MSKMQKDSKNEENYTHHDPLLYSIQVTLEEEKDSTKGKVNTK